MLQWSTSSDVGVNELRGDMRRNYPRTDEGIRHWGIDEEDLSGRDAWSHIEQISEDTS